MNNVVLNTQDNNNKIASRTLRKKPNPQRVNGWGIVEPVGERFAALTDLIANCHGWLLISLLYHSTTLSAILRYNHFSLILRSFESLAS